MTPLGMPADKPGASPPPEEPTGDAALVTTGAGSGGGPALTTPGGGPTGDAALVATGADPLGEAPRRRFAWLGFVNSWWYWAAGALLWLVLAVLGTGWFRYAAFALAIYDGGFAVVRYRGLSRARGRGPKRDAGPPA